MPSIKDYSIEETKRLFKEIGFPSFRADQVLSWLYEKGVSSYGEMTNIPKAMREQLTSALPFEKPVIVARQKSFDGTKKYLLKLSDGALVETVGLPTEDGRLTVCCSTQAGCAMKCSFCATGMLGLTRNLSPGEIVDQVITVQEEFGTRVTNVVAMGQGEPFMNYDATLSALRIMNHPKLLNIGARHITVSTCGVLKGIDRFSQEKEQFTLAVSLHSALQSTRNMLIPSMNNQPLEDLRTVLRAYSEKSGRRFTFEYALMKGINDGDEELEALVDYCKGLLCHVNLIPLNDVDGSSYQPVSAREMKRWNEELERRGIASTIRRSQGGDIAAACGQLSSSMSKKDEC